MSWDAVRWALDQPVSTALSKFLLVAMADCVNAEAKEPVCWPSYAFLARRTGMNSKTVEAGVYRLREEGYIVDTGKRAGDTGKVVVYRLNDPNCGGVLPGPQSPDAIGTRPSNDPNSGANAPGVGGIPNDPKNAGNPPKKSDQRPQKVDAMTPKTGSRSSNGSRKEPVREPGKKAPAVAVAAIEGVPQSVMADWLAVRRDKRAGTLTPTAVEGLLREAAKAGLTPEAAVRYCVERNWVGFNAGWFLERNPSMAPQRSLLPVASRGGNRQADLEDRNQAAVAAALGEGA